MTDFLLRTHRNQPLQPEPTILLDWFDGGRGSTIQTKQSVTAHLTPSRSALDFLRFSAAVYCADRLSLRPGIWTRSISIKFPIRNLAAWNAVNEDLTATLNFLSGDNWNLVPFAPTLPRDTEVHDANSSVDAVCLFSGGLDSFTGALDLLTQGKTVCLVSHYEGGQAPKIQMKLAHLLAEKFGHDKVIHRTIFLRPSPVMSGQTRPLPKARESSTRSRSLLFIASGLVVASGYGPEVPLLMPENGFIGINAPLTRARSGSLSTRTTHPHFMMALAECTKRLNISNQISNPFRLMTKGEMLAACTDQRTLLSLAHLTLSCSHPEASRYAKRKQGNCGYCFPCLIRRAAMSHIGLDNPDEYAFDALQDETGLSGARGGDLRALIRSLAEEPRQLDVLRNGPVAAEDVEAFADVHQRGQREILAWIQKAKHSTKIQSQISIS